MVSKRGPTITGYGCGAHVSTCASIGSSTSLDLYPSSALFSWMSSVARTCFDSISLDIVAAPDGVNDGVNESWDELKDRDRVAAAINLMIERRSLSRRQASRALS